MGDDGLVRDDGESGLGACACGNLLVVKVFGPTGGREELEVGLVFGEFADGDEVDCENVTDEVDGLEEEFAEWGAIEGECADFGDGFLANGFDFELCGGVAEFCGPFFDALFEGFLCADDGFSAFVFSGDVVKESDHAAFFAGGMWEKKTDRVNIDEGSVFVLEAELEVEG